MPKRQQEQEFEETEEISKKLKSTDGDSSSNKVVPLSDNENALLANLMAYHMREVEGVSFEKCATDLGFMTRTKSWCKAWKQLIEKGLVVSCTPGGARTTADHCLTAAGKAQASTPEYEEFVKDKTFVAATNQDHQDRIKKRLINDKIGQRGVQIFDLLLEHGELTRKELCGILEVRSGTHSFSYALKELKDKHLVLGKGFEKLRLADKAFLDPGTDRPSHVSDQTMIDSLLAKSKYANEFQMAKDKKTNSKKTKESSTNNKIMDTEKDSSSSSKVTSDEINEKEHGIIDTETKGTDEDRDGETIVSEDASASSS